MTSKQPARTAFVERRKPVCRLAPEWAEHARLADDADVCDDGREGRSCGNRKGESPCPYPEAP